MKNVPQKHESADLFNFAWPSWFHQTPFFHKSNVAIWEEPKEVIVEAAAPGMLPGDIEMDFSKGMLTVRGQRKEDKSDEKKKFFQHSDSSFVYHLTVPGDVDEKSEPTAELKDGMLTIRFKKKSAVARKKIPVKHVK